MTSRSASNRRRVEGDPPTCPACGLPDGVEKASSVVRKNSGQFFTERTSYQFKSVLASQLAPPQAPLRPTWQSFAVKITTNLALAVLIAAGLYLINQMAIDVPQAVEIALAVPILWFGLMTPVRASLDFVEARRTLQVNFSDWLDAKERWASLYYCSRDDVGFVKGEAEYRSPETVSELLYLPLVKSPAVSQLVASDAAAVPLT